MPTTLLKFVSFYFLLTHTLFGATCSTSPSFAPPLPYKVLICGVGKNVAPFIPNTIKNMEELGLHFLDYHVIVYENDSTDATRPLFQKWAEENSHVDFLYDTLKEQAFAESRPEKIARARNIVLEKAREPQFHDFDFLIMADLDFITPWPIEEILKCLQLQIPWDGIFANGILKGVYYDRYAHRNSTYPLGPELLGDIWWKIILSTPFAFSSHDLQPVYSAFGGLGLYKTKSLLPFSYSGTVTEDLKSFYQNLFHQMSPNNPFLVHYLKINGLSGIKIPILFRNNCLENNTVSAKATCCEHVPLHASMILSGYGKLYINPKLVMTYQ